MSANSRPVRDSANAIGTGTTRPIRTQTMWSVTGKVCGHTITRRISAPDYDAAITEAHAIPMAVDTCTQIHNRK